VTGFANSCCSGSPIEIPTVDSGASSEAFN
jgi:hypothetical protein